MAIKEKKIDVETVAVLMRGVFDGAIFKLPPFLDRSPGIRGR